MPEQDPCDEAARRILGAIEQNHRKVCWCTDSDKQKVAAIIREVVAEPMQAELTRVRALAQRNASRARGMLG